MLTSPMDSFSLKCSQLSASVSRARPGRRIWKGRWMLRYLCPDWHGQDVATRPDEYIPVKETVWKLSTKSLLVKSSHGHALAVETQMAIIYRYSATISILD